MPSVTITIPPFSLSPSTHIMQVFQGCSLMRVTSPLTHPPEIKKKYIYIKHKEKSVTKEITILRAI